MFQEILQNQFWACEPVALESFIARMNSHLGNDYSDIEQSMGLFDAETKDQKPYQVVENIAVIPIVGPLVKRAPGFLAWLLGITGMEAIGRDFKQALSDPQVKGIFLDVDSPGGTVSGTSDLADIIFAGRGQKPIMTFADGLMCSAAQWIGGASDYVVAANEVSQLGSVGVFAVHFDFADRAKNLGITPTIFAAGRYKGIGNKFEHLTKEGKEYISEQMNYLHQKFIEGVSRNTGIPINKLDDDLKEAKVFMGSQAVVVDLADAVMNRDAAMSLLRDVVEKRTTFLAAKRGAKKYIPVIRKTAEAKTEKRFENADLVQVIKSVNGCKTIDELSRIESELSAEFERRESSAGNWMDKESAQAFKVQCSKIVDFRRRQIMSRPIVEKQMRQYEIGRAIASKK